MADLTITDAQVAPVNETEYVARTYIAAADIAAGRAVYVTAAGKVDLARANATGTTQGLVGVATHAAKAGRPVEVLMQGSLAGMGIGGVAYGAPVYLSGATAGALADAANATTGQFNVPVGRVLPMSDPALSKVLYIDIRPGAVYAANA
jgi:hypothetical protein